MMAKSANLGAAKNAKQDEFYTQLSDIEKEMRHYRRHFKDKTILCNCDDPKALEADVSRLMADEDVTKKSGVYEYLLTGQERCLSIRAFDDRMKRAAYERQGGVCPYCGEHFELSEMHADHIKPWAKGGPTTAENCQMLCRDCNLKKSDD